MDPSEKLGESRIAAQPKPNVPGVIDLAKLDEQTLNYLKRAKKRRI